MTNSTYSGIDQEPNGKPVRANGTAPSLPTSTPTDELAKSRMDEEGAAQSPHMRNESGEFPRSA